MASTSKYRHLRYNKKGQVYQVAFIIVILMVMALAILVSRKLVTEAYNAFDEGGYNYTSVKQAEANILKGYNSFDYGYILMTILLTVFLVFTSFMIPTHPIFLVVNVVGIFFLVFMGMMLTNLYAEAVASGDAELGTEAGYYPKMNYIMSYLPYLAAVLIFLTTIIQYTRPNGAMQ